MLKGVDTNQPLTRWAKMLKDKGIDYTGRYYRPGVTAPGNLLRSEVEELLSAGLAIVPVYQYLNNRLSYFTVERGIKDGREAVKRAKEVRQPEGTNIYCAFDTDFNKMTAKNVALPYMIEFSRRVKKAGYLVGAYGDKQILEVFSDTHIPDLGDVIDLRWLTNAWGWDTKLDDFHVHQTSTPYTIFPGLSVDNNVSPDWAIETMWRPS